MCHYRYSLLEKLTRSLGERAPTPASGTGRPGTSDVLFGPECASADRVRGVAPLLHLYGVVQRLPQTAQVLGSSPGFVLRVPWPVLCSGLTACNTILYTHFHYLLY